MTKLPVLISIPHGGMNMPKELQEGVCITKYDLFDDIDPYVIEIYDLKDKVQKVISTDIARTFVDLNRSLQDLPPKKSDGLIKSMTCYQKPIYIKGKEPDETLTNLLISSYYKPYHRQIQIALPQLDLQVALDCHSMAPSAPLISPDGNQKKRPIFCLSNQDGKTSSNKMLELLAKCIKDSFSLNDNDINLNDPFKGGYITQTYGNNPIPWIQIEMSRSLYLENPWFDKSKLTIDKSRLDELKSKFEKAITQFFNEIE